MNPGHLSAIVRMRWRIMSNQFRKSGDFNRIVTIVLLVVAAFGSFCSFIFVVGWGKFFLAKMDPFYVIYAWDALAALFLCAWVIALVIELQRSEILSLKNLLHLPISLSGAFLLNYASSLASLTLLLFLPAMIGLCLASIWQFGGKSLVVFALLTSFLLMVTAVSYQLRGWLARLMENKRTRGTVIAVTTITFIMIFQIPNAINLGSLQSRDEAPRARLAAHQTRLAELEDQQTAGEITIDKYTTEVKAAEEEFGRQETAIRKAETAAMNHTAAVVNAVLPIGWLPFGASAAARGAVLSPLLCVLGMSTIGFGSLVMSYRATLRAYTGDHNREYRPVARKKAKAFARHSMLEKSVPFLTEAQSATTMATLRSLIRAPEAKMALLTPLILACVFGSMLLTGKIDKLPEFVRPWFGVGALGVSLLGMVQMILNMFGLDRQGFRAYILMPVARRDILLGKNMGVFPVAGILSALLIVFLGAAGRMYVTHIIASLLQIVIAYFIYFIVSNFTSIVAPLGMAVGSMKPVSMNFAAFVLQFVAVLLVPVAILPAAVALGIEQLASMFWGLDGIPIYLLLTVIQLPCALWFYSTILHLQGRHLQRREQMILDVVSKVAN